MTEELGTHPKTPLRKGVLRSFVRWLVIGVVLVWSHALILLAARWIESSGSVPLLLLLSFEPIGLE